MAIQRSSLFAAVGVGAMMIVAGGATVMSTEELEEIVATSLPPMPRPTPVNVVNRSVWEIDHRIDLLEEVLVDVQTQLDQAMTERAEAGRHARARAPVPRARVVETASLEPDQDFGTLAFDERGDLADAVVVQAAAPALPPAHVAVTPNDREATRRGLRIGQIHFNMGTARLSPGALLRVQEAVAQIKAAPDRPIRVVAFTDSTGSSRLNRRLSLERAVAIADHLERAGVDGRLIELVANGEHNPPIPTADGIAEPLNRCAGIFLVDD